MSLIPCSITDMLAGLGFLPGASAADFGNLSPLEQVQSSPMQSMASLESLEHNSRALLLLGIDISLPAHIRRTIFPLYSEFICFVVLSSMVYLL
jgi:hypothetical protein